MSVLDTQPCNFCGHQQAAHFLTLTDLRLKLPGTWKLVKCENCGLLFLSPQPTWDDLSAHYPKEYHAYLRKGSKITDILRGFGLRNRVKSVLRNTNVTKGRLLDVGCATGDFLNTFRDMTSWDVVGLEIVPEAAAVAKAKGLPIIEDELENANLDVHSFVVITLWDVLEHMADPTSTLKICFDALSPQGLLVIKCPDPSGREASLFKESWIGYEAPQHLYGFPREVLEKKLIEIGFKSVNMSQTGSDYPAFFVSLGHWLNRQGWLKLSEIIINLTHTPIGRVLAGVLVRPIRFFGVRSSCTYYCQKSHH